MQARHPHLFAALDNDTVSDADRLQAQYRAVDVVVEDETESRFAGLSNQEKMFHKIGAASTLSRLSGRSYDLEMRIRPDISLLRPLFSWSRLRALCRRAPVVFVETGFGLNYGKLHMGDQMAVGSPEAMAFYATTAERYATLAPLGLDGVPAALVGHHSLAQTCWHSGLTVKTLPFSINGLLDMRPLSTDRILSALRADAAGRNDTIDRDLLAAALSDAGVSPAAHAG